MCASREYVHEVLGGTDIILGVESAAEYWGISDGSITNNIFVMVQRGSDVKLPNNPDVKLVFIDYEPEVTLVERNGTKVYVTTPNQTIIDMLRNNRDEQATLESLFNYYCEHGESYDGLEIPDDIRDDFNKLKDDATHYLDD